jgi:hypothetical protein
VDERPQKQAGAARAGWPPAADTTPGTVIIAQGLLALTALALLASSVFGLLAVVSGGFWAVRSADGSLEALSPAALLMTAVLFLLAASALRAILSRRPRRTVGAVLAACLIPVLAIAALGSPAAAVQFGASLAVISALVFAGRDWLSER